MSTTALQARFKVGDTYRTRGKHPRLCTIRNILSTYNLQGELVCIRYVADHELNGQVITDYEVCETTVLMGVL